MGLARLLLVALLAGTNLWLAQGAFEPLVSAGEPRAYVLVSPSFARFLAWAAGSVIVLLALQVVVWRRSRGSFSDALGDARHLDPLWWSALSLLPLVNLHPAFAGRWPAATYLLWDLRWCWWLVLVAAVWRRVDSRLTDGAPRRMPAWATVVGLVTIPVVVATAFTPNLRFSGHLHGDEPKYLRVAENLVQGVGFDIAAKRRLADLPADFTPRVFDNVGLLVRATAEEAGLLLDDARRLMGGGRGTPLRAGQPTPDLFFDGKHPGTVYQLHNPGLSFLLLPGYLLDRTITGDGLGYQGEFPAAMPATHLTLLALYAGYGLALFALLRAVTPRRELAFALALAGSIALPTGAFGFQIYPEVAAGFMVFLLARELIAPAAASRRRAVVLGAIAGFLPWLHVRLGLVTLVAIAVYVVAPTRTHAARAWFATGAAAGLASLSLYTYRLTGSLLPMATYGEEAPLSLARAAQGVPAFFLDRDWGLLAHSPIYLLAIPGMVLAWRERRSMVWTLGALLAAVVVPAAGHGFWAGGSTPGRYLVAGVPLLLVFALFAIERAWTRRWPAAAIVLLGLLSLESAVAYNLDHVKEFGPLVSTSAGGWRPNLLFPSLGIGAWTRAAIDLILLLVWLTIAAGLAVWPSAANATSARGAGRAGGPRLRDVVVCLLAVALAGEAVAIATSRSTSERYLTTRADARDRALLMLSTLPQCAICYVTGRGSGDPSAALDNEATLVDVRVDTPDVRAGRIALILIRPRNAEGAPILGTLRIDYGDGVTEAFRSQYGDRRVAHTYARAGTYRVRVWFRSPTGAEVADETEVNPRE